MAEQTILLTGSAGFVGQHLLAELGRRSSDARIVGVDHVHHTDAPDGANVSLVELDLRSRDDVLVVIRETQPDVILHLAAISHVPTSFADPELTWNVNAMGTLHVLEAIRRGSPETKLVFVSSSEVYGRSLVNAQGAPITEDAPLEPVNPYASSKAAGDLLVRQYAQQKMHTVCVRPFNHVGPGQSKDFALSRFASEIARIEKGLADPVLHVGNLDVSRDFLDVRDVVRAYAMIIEQIDSIPAGTALNIASGVPRPLDVALQDLCALAECRIDIEVSPELFRPTEVKCTNGDSSRLKALLGWTPEIPWETTLQDILNDWRSRTQAEEA
jgi:GDP-4-dehydro-6-deoxy-D-mannose reductase